MSNLEYGAAAFVFLYAFYRLVESLNASAEERNKRLLEELTRIRALLQDYDGSSALKNMEIMMDRELERQSDIRHEKRTAELDTDLLTGS